MPRGPRAPRLSLWLAAAVALLIAAAVALTLRAPARDAPAPVTASAPAVALPVLAETTGEEGTLSIAVISLEQVSGDTVELRLAVTNTAPAGAPPVDLAQRFSADGPDRGTLAEVYLADMTHQQKFFVLRDAENAPMGSRDVLPLRAGQRRVLWARYPAPPNRDAEVVVHVPHAEPMPNIAVGTR